MDIVNCKACGSKPIRKEFTNSCSTRASYEAEISCKCGIKVVEGFSVRVNMNESTHIARERCFSQAMNLAEINWNNLHKVTKCAK